MRPNTLHRHIDTNYPEMKDKPLEFCEKKLVSKNFKTQNIFNFTDINQKVTYASYKISNELFKQVSLTQLVNL
jgi:hypothetical protein